MLCDLHNHTTFSYDGSNTPEEIVENAMANCVDVVGITDHQFSIEGNLQCYIDKINSLKDKYSGRIRVLCGLEIGTRPEPRDFLASASKKLDYCLFECTDSSRAMDFYEFLEWTRLFVCPKGLAHTDIFALEKRYGIDIFNVLKEYSLFWEINVSGNYVYYYDFITNPEKRERIRKSGITLSIGSDTHWTGDYNAGKLISAVKLAEELGNPLFLG